MEKNKSVKKSKSSKRNFKSRKITKRRSMASKVIDNAEKINENLFFKNIGLSLGGTNFLEASHAINNLFGAYKSQKKGNYFTALMALFFANLQLHELLN